MLNHQFWEFVGNLFKKMIELGFPALAVSCRHAVSSLVTAIGGARRPSLKHEDAVAQERLLQANG